MKKLCVAALSCILAVSVVFVTGCEWSSGGGDGGGGSYNTSQGAGINVNFSGVYHGNYSGGKAVENTSNGNITRLVIQQVGNSITITDNQGSQYSGYVGAPGTANVPGSGGTIGAGAEVMQAQINFSGHDNVAAQHVEFSGIIHVVTVADVTSSESSGSSSSGTTLTSTETYPDGTNRVVVETWTEGTPTSHYYRVETVTTKYGGDTENVIDRKVETTTKQSTSSSYTLTEANSQYRLEGTWIETDGGVVSGVDALSAGTSGVITTTNSTTTTTVDTQ